MPTYYKDLHWVSHERSDLLPEDRHAILDRDCHRCAYCGGDADAVDHIQPKSNGGGNGDVNLIACCRYCNSRKGARTPLEADMQFFWSTHLADAYMCAYASAEPILVDPTTHSIARAAALIYVAYPAGGTECTERKRGAPCDIVEGLGAIVETLFDVADQLGAVVAPNPYQWLLRQTFKYGLSCNKITFNCRIWFEEKFYWKDAIETPRDIEQNHIQYQSFVALRDADMGRNCHSLAVLPGLNATIIERVARATRKAGGGTDEVIAALKLESNELRGAPMVPANAPF